MDIVQIIGNLLLITFLGILVAFNPMLIVVDILLVLKTKRPILNAIILIGGFASSILFLFFLAQSVIDPNSEISLKKLNSSLDIPPLVNLTAGLLLFSYSIKKYRRYKSRGRSAKQTTLKIPNRPYQLFCFAFIKAALSVTNLFAIIILAKQSVLNHWNAAVGLIAVLWLLIIGIVPLVTIAYYRQFKHESLISIDKRINRFLSRDSEILIIYTLWVVSAFFIISGAVSLLKK